MSQVIEIAGHKFKLIGDPHLGRVFKTGVPTHRIGERETDVTLDFTQQVSSSDNTPIIVMGDLFDK